jgi:glucokinase
MKYSIDKDQRIVMTLDAGGTNFVFSAIQGNMQIIAPIRLYPNSEDLSKCLETIISGFEIVKSKLKKPAVAISFAFPGPADYPNGIIGDLPNLPSFRGGVALGAMLEHHFNMPVFINNDGNLFAYGEALFGFLPEINQNLKEVNSHKQFNNLIGVTLGTGFGVGLVCNNQLITGDNSNGGEAWLLRDVLSPEYHAEEHLSREGIRRSFADKANLHIEEVGAPQEIYDIAKGKIEGNKKAAIATYNDFGTVLGEALATIITLFDGIVVLGGGVSGAFDLFAPAMFEQLESNFKLYDGGSLHRLVPRVFNLEDTVGKSRLLDGQQKELKIPQTNKTIIYDPFLRTGVGVSKNSTSKIIGLGAYAYAINKLDE